MSTLDKLRTRPKVWASAALVTVGLASGAVLGATMTAGASTTSSTSAPSSAAPSVASPEAGGSTWGPGRAGGFQALSKSGTVTAVGAHSVTISGVTYAVTSSSDIDKNGEATVAKLAVGDKVTFSTVTSASTATIDKLHAGSESLDRPTGPPSGAPDGAAQAGPGSLG